MKNDGSLRPLDMSLENLSESSPLSSNDGRLSLDAFMAWVHSRFPVEVVLTAIVNRTDWDPVVSSAIPNRDKKKGKDLIVHLVSTKTFSVKHLEKTETV